jgi:Protein of unknown function (DUF3606)
MKTVFKSICGEITVTHALPIDALPPETLARQPIDITHQDSVNYWSSALGCSEFDLRMAVAEVGPTPKDVGNELGKPL